MVSDTGSIADHVDLVVKESWNRMRQLRRLTNPKWGPTPSLVRTFWVGYGLGKMLYGAEVWGSLLTGKERERLDVIHKAACRVITGCLQTTRLPDLFLEARLPPIFDIINKRIIRYFCRCETWEHNDARRVEAQSLIPYLRRHLHLLEWLRSCHPYATFYNSRPIASLRPPSISFLGSFPPRVEGEDKEKVKAEKRRLNEERMAGIAAQHPRDTEYQCYTDGSVELGVRSGAGAVIFLPSSHTPVVLKKSCGPHSCSMRAECVAISLCLQYFIDTLLSHPIKRIRLFTDSLSAVQALSADKGSTDTLVCKIWDQCRMLYEEKGLSVHFSFIYSHVGLEGNELVDVAAGEAALERVEEGTCCFWEDAAHAFVRTIKKRRGELFSEFRVSERDKSGRDPSHRFLALNKMCYTPRSSFLLPRGVAVLLARLRTGSHPLIGKFPARLQQAPGPCRWCVNPTLYPVPPPHRPYLCNHSKVSLLLISPRGQGLGVG